MILLKQNQIDEFNIFSIIDSILVRVFFFSRYHQYFQFIYDIEKRKKIKNIFLRIKEKLREKEELKKIKIKIIILMIINIL